MTIPPSDISSVEGSTTIFETRRLKVRAAILEDVELFNKLWTNPQVMSNVGFPRGLRITRDEIMDKLLKPVESEFEKMLVVVMKTNDQAIGECKMHPPNEDKTAAEVLGEQVWRGDQKRAAGLPIHPHGLRRGSSHAEREQHRLHQDAGSGWW
jgi:RimJ/RimL family protein N-acetyltransferase